MRTKKITAAQRRTVRRLLAQDHSLTAIAAVIGMSRNTLKIHFKQEIEIHKKGGEAGLITHEQRGMVQAMSGFGLTQEQISTVLDVSVDYVQVHFKNEIITGVPLATARVASALFAAATGGDVSAMKFWLACRAGWKAHLAVDGVIEHKHEMSEVDIKSVERRELERLDDEGREHLRLALEQLGASSLIDSSGPTDEDVIN